MKVNFLPSQPYNKPSFGTNAKTYYRNTLTNECFSKDYYSSCIPCKDSCEDDTQKTHASIINSNATWFFRSKPYDWLELCKFLNSKYKNSEPVNIYQFGCSDGSETYTIIMSLLEALHKDSEKYFPIQAYDIDPDIIEKARSKQVCCNLSDISSIDNNTQQGFSKYFSTIAKVTPTSYIASANDILKDKAVFKVKSFLEGLDDIKTKNNIIFCRNFWPYMKDEEAKECFIKMRNLEGNNLFIFGDFDYDMNFRYLYTKCGFEEIFDGVLKKNNLQATMYSDDEIRKMDYHGYFHS